MGAMWSGEQVDSNPGFENFQQPILNVTGAGTPVSRSLSISAASPQDAKALPVRNPFVMKTDEVYIKRSAGGDQSWNLHLKYTATQKCHAILYRHVTGVPASELSSCSTPETIPADWEPRTKQDLEGGENMVASLKMGRLQSFDAAETGTELLLLNVAPVTTETNAWQQWHYLKFEAFKSGTDAYMLSHSEQKMQMGKHLFSVKKIYSTRDEAAQATTATCLICSSSAANIMVLPCRHLCLCGECAAVMRLRDQKCPICRGAISQLLQLETTVS